jgi:hypothetical protein
MNKEITKKISLILAIALLFLINVVNLFISKSSHEKNDQETFSSEATPKEVVKNNCDVDIREESYKIKDSSLANFFKSGSNVKVLLDYYQCNEVKRGDVVLYKADSQSEPIIKIVKGIPGDAFGMQGDGTSWNILINNEIIATPQGDLHQVNAKDGDDLIVYFQKLSADKDAIPTIPPKEYLLIENIASGGIENAPFGLADISGIIGKVVVN